MEAKVVVVGESIPIMAKRVEPTSISRDNGKAKGDIPIAERTLI